MGQRMFGFVGRRSLLKSFGAMSLSAAVVACTKNANQSTTATPEATTAAALEDRKPNWEMTPDEALQLLMDGNKRFIDGKTIHPRIGPTRRSETGADQFPFAAFLSCADSRVPVEILFDQGIGDCFVCRVAGNIATPENVGSLEFGTFVLGSKVLMVLGHEGCGAVVAAMGRTAQFNLPPGTDLGKTSIPSLLPFLTPGVQDIEKQIKEKGVASLPITEEKGADDVMATTEAVVKRQVEALMKSPVLSSLVQANKLKIVGAYYDLDTGEIKMVV